MKVKEQMMAIGFALMGVLPLKAENDEPRIIQIVYEVFSLSKSEAAKTQREALADREAYAKMVAGLENGKVKQEKLQAIRSLSGQKSSSQHISEFLYATDFEPPEIPNEVGVSVTSPLITKEKPSGEEKIDSLKSGPGWSQGSFPATPATGTSFDTKNTGDSLEVEAMVNEASDQIDLRFSANDVTLVGFETWGKSLSEVKMPLFSTKRITSSLQVKAGVPILVGTVSPSPTGIAEGGEERVWFAFVTASVVKVES